jgi:hypothetical protein
MRWLATLVTRLVWVARISSMPATAYAQATIAGIVRDTSGAVLPGVTVEAASPALIEKVRSVVTDGTGQYQIVNLAPGTYSVTYTLPGFNTVTRAGVELAGSFTAKIDADLRVGARTSNLSVGFALNQFQNDFGLGVVMTTPYFANNRMSVRLSANVGFLNGVPERTSTVERMPYQLYKVGIVGVGGPIRDGIRLYGEGGAIIIVPNKDFSDDNPLGGYGLFGFEFFLHESGGMSYFIELGGVRTLARAEKIATRPFYSNGFTISTGFKHYFGRR